jgi:F-type H+-transporting ATPase subunit b
MALVIGLLPTLGRAAELSHGETHEGLPSVLWVQAFNFTIYLAILVFILRKPVKSYFYDRKEKFRQALIKAQAAHHEAEQRRLEIQARLEKLESTTSESIERAHEEASALRLKISQEAMELTKKLKDEALLTAQIEIERAKAELREEVLSQALKVSRKALVEQINDQDHKRLQSEFASNIHVVS